MGLVNYARRELELLGEDAATIAEILPVVGAFADMRTREETKERVMDLLGSLFKRKNLTPLTDDPSEWEDVSKVSGYSMLQNLRNPAAFSYDGGKTYILVTDHQKNIIPTKAHSPGY